MVLASPATSVESGSNGPAIPGLGASIAVAGSFLTVAGPSPAPESWTLTATATPASDPVDPAPARPALTTSPAEFSEQPGPLLTSPASPSFAIIEPGPIDGVTFSGDGEGDDPGAGDDSDAGDEEDEGDEADESEDEGDEDDDDDDSDNDDGDGGDGPEDDDPGGGGLSGDGPGGPVDPGDFGGGPGDPGDGPGGPGLSVLSQKSVK